MKTRLFLFCFLCWQCVIAQNTTKGNLIGTVTDSLAKSPVVYATVALFEMKDTLAATTPLQVQFTDDKGAFQFKDLPLGVFKIEIAMINLAPKQLNALVLNEEIPSRDLGNIMLLPDSLVVQTVLITAQRPILEIQDEKVVYNVENDLTVQTGAALDVMKKIPYVFVDAQDKIQVKGSTSFKVLLNGKSSGMVAKNPSEALKMFPANTIKKIEVITEPGAKYNSDGTQAVINIITKKQISGYNGGINTRFNSLVNGSVYGNLNAKYGKWGFSSYLSQYGGSAPTSYNESTFRNLSSTNPYTQTTSSQNRSRYLNSWGGGEIAYDIDSLKALSVYIGGTPRWDGARSQALMVQLSDTGALQRSSDRRSQQGAFTYGANVGADYIQKIGNNESNHEWSFSIAQSWNRNHDTTETLTLNFPEASRRIKVNNREKESESAINIDYERPIKKEQKLSLGAKSVVRVLGSDFRSSQYDSLLGFVDNPLLTNTFDYTQAIYSAYGEYKIKVKKLNINFGLRTEHTRINGQFYSTNTEIRNHYTNVLPTLRLHIRPKQGLSFSLSYRQNLSRPGIDYLNPFVNNANPYNISYGNPTLSPEQSHDVSFSSNFIGKIGNLNIRLSQGFERKSISSFLLFDESKGVTTTTYQNIGKGTASRLMINYSLQKKKVSAYIYSQLVYNTLVNNNGLEIKRNAGFSGNLYGYFSYSLPKNAFVSANGNFYRQNVGIQSVNGIFYNYGLGLGKQFLNKKLSISLTADNFLERYRRFRSATIDPKFTGNSLGRSPFRSFSISINYNFGKLQESVSRKKGISNDDVKSSGGGQ